MSDALYWFASNQGKLDAVLKCPQCGVRLVTAGDPEASVPRKLQPCQCVVCTKCGGLLRPQAINYHTFHQ